MNHPHGYIRHLLPLAVCVCAFFLLTPLALASWPVDVFIVRTTGKDPSAEIIRAPALLGREVTASIIHSVQLTPVVDTYRIQEGRLWTWEERIRSHSAGLPSVTPPRGRFFHDPPWMVVQGAASAIDPLYYRVGTKNLGSNVLCALGESCQNLWETVPGKRLEFTIAPGNL